MSLFNPRSFDYLKLEANAMREDFSAYYTYPLTCVKSDSITETFNMNSSWSLNFEVFDDGSAGFHNFNEQSIIWAGDQPFAVQSYTRKEAGTPTASVTANHYTYSEFKRLVQPKRLSYQLKTDGQGNGKFYCTLEHLLRWFFDGIDKMRFQFDPKRDIHGWFPIRPISGINASDEKVSGDKLINAIKSTWPGTYVVPNGFHLEFYGYAQERDQYGNLVNIADLDTGQRFDSLPNMSDFNVQTSRAGMCNAIMVRSATYTKKEQKQDDDDDDDDANETTGNEFVYSTYHWFPDNLITSNSSIKKYGLYYNTEILDEGFTKLEPAIAAAREKMVTHPIVTVTGTIHTPGRTPAIPAPGRIYTVGDTQAQKIYHVKVTGFTWHKDPTKGLQLTLSSVVPGVTDLLHSTIIHELTTDPQLTDFKADELKELKEKDQEDKEQDEDQQTDSDQSSDRQDDNGDGTSDNNGSDSGSQGDNQSGDQTGANDGTGSTSNTTNQYTDAGSDGPNYLPVWDGWADDPQAMISAYANITVNREQRRWYFRRADGELISNLMTSNIDSDLRPHEEDPAFDHVMALDMGRYSIDSITTDHGEHHHNKDNHDFWLGTDAYFGGTMISSTGTFVTQGNQITFRSHASQKDLDHKGFYKRTTYKSKDGKKTYTSDIHPSGWEDDTDLDNVKWKHVENPGVLATLQFHQAGSVKNPIKAIFTRFLGSANRFVTNAWIKHIEAKSIGYGKAYQTSQLSKKKDVKPLSHTLSLDRIMKTHLFSYHFKDDTDKEYQASVVIDDVNNDDKYKTPEAYVNKNRTGRKDSVILADAVNVIQLQQKEITDLKKRLDKLESKS